MVDGINSVHYPLTLQVGGAGCWKGCTFLCPSDIGDWTSIGDASQGTSFIRI